MPQAVQAETATCQHLTCRMATSVFSWASCLVGKRSLSITLMATSRFVLRWRPEHQTQRHHHHSTLASLTGREEEATPDTDIGIMETKDLLGESLLKHSWKFNFFFFYIPICISGFATFGEIFGVCDSFFPSNCRGSHIPYLWMVHAGCIFVCWH